MHIASIIHGKSPRQDVITNKTLYHMSSSFIHVTPFIHTIRASRVLALVRKEMEVWESLNWMSTLGGAYSCLGEHNTMFVSIIE